MVAPNLSKTRGFKKVVCIFLIITRSERGAHMPREPRIQLFYSLLAIRAYRPTVPMTFFMVRTTTTAVCSLVRTFTWCAIFSHNCHYLRIYQ